MTDIDLHVQEPPPFGEKAFFGHRDTKIHGLVSKDFTQGILFF
jgi:uncharacterized protein YfaP (DUF2135 family)